MIICTTASLIEVQSREVRSAASYNLRAHLPQRLASIRTADYGDDARYNRGLWHFTGVFLVV